MRTIYLNEEAAAKHGGYALASFVGENGDSVYVNVFDIIETLQNEANSVAGDLMQNELNPGPDEFDRRYAIGRWDKLNELISLFKNS